MKLGAKALFRKAKNACPNIFRNMRKSVLGSCKKWVCGVQFGDIKSNAKKYYQKIEDEKERQGALSSNGTGPFSLEAFQRPSAKKEG